MDIRINDEYRLRARDPLNWELCGMRRGKDGQMRMKPLGRYYQRLGDALAAVYEAGLRAEPGEMTLGQAVRKADEIRKSLLEVER